MTFDISQHSVLKPKIHNLFILIVVISKSSQGKSLNEAQYLSSICVPE